MHFSDFVTPSCISLWPSFGHWRISKAHHTLYLRPLHHCIAWVGAGVSRRADSGCRKPTYALHIFFLTDSRTFLPRYRTTRSDSTGMRAWADTGLQRTNYFQDMGTCMEGCLDRGIFFLFGFIIWYHAGRSRDKKYQDGQRRRGGGPWHCSGVFMGTGFCYFLSRRVYLG